jgi:hypothetical protein
MKFDSFSLGTCRLFQNVVLFFFNFFLFDVIHVIQCCFQNKNFYQNYKKKYVFAFEFFFFFLQFNLETLGALRKFSRPFCSLFTNI